MKTIIQNSNIKKLLLSNVFNAFGNQIFNIALLIYASNQSYSVLAITLVTWFNFLPDLFAPLQGFRADNIAKKSAAMWKIHLLQAAIFLVYAMFLRLNITFEAFVFLLLLGFVSDYYGAVANYLSQPIAKIYLKENNIRKFVNFNTTINRIISVVGQSIGLIILTFVHHNYAILALINAATFIIAALFVKQISDHHFKVQSAKQSHQTFSDFIYSMTSAIKILHTKKFLSVIFVLAIVNSFLDALGLLINLAVKSIGTLQFQTFSFSMVIINTTSSLAVITGSLILIPLFEKWTFFQLNTLVLIIMTIQLTNFLFLQNFIVLIIAKFLTTLLIAYQGPKITDIFLKTFPTEKLGSISGLLNIILTAGGPVALLLNSIITNLGSITLAVQTTLFIVVSALIILLLQQVKFKKVN
ncbi:MULTISPECIES: MFS transporter [Leuconostoc]|uniref:MFS transporter n=1 Tax=Leuconostoc TaxID=1243 RepID=UPI0024A7BDE5|nr:MFS transporter [Leuconostoc falkenbergense]MDI6552628.1 hypothetical protein [Leuconostoc falkenbergense]